MKAGEKRGRGQKREQKTFQFSLASKKVFGALDKKQKDLIRKENPFCKLRDEAIRELLKKGVKGVVLAEITGLTDSTISRINRAARYPGAELLGGNGKIKFNKKEPGLIWLQIEFGKLIKKYQAFIVKTRRKEVKNLGRCVRET